MGILNMESIMIDCRLRKRGSLQLQENQDLSCVSSSNSSGNTRVSGVRRHGYVRSHSSQQLGVTGRDDEGDNLMCVTSSQSHPSRSEMTHSSSQHVLHRTGSGGHVVGTGRARREASLDRICMTSDGIRRTGSNHDIVCMTSDGVQRSGSTHDLVCMTSDGSGYRGHQGCVQRHSFGGNSHQLMYMPRAVIHRGGHHPRGRHSYHSRSSWLIGDLASLRPDWPLKFHQVRGDNVELNNDESQAKRGDSFCKAICFSNRPIAVNERVYIKFAETSSSWSGVLRFGFTNIDPGSLRGSDLPRYACPDMTNKPGNWAKALAERYATPNNLLHFYVTRTGDVYYGVNGEDVGLFFSGVNTSEPIWALLDIYGNTIAVEFVNPEQPVLNNMVSSAHSSNIVSSGDVNSDLISALSSLTVNSGQQSVISTSEFPTVRHYANVTFNPLRWHSLCGKNIQFSHNRTVAARVQEEYCNGYVFSSRPLKCGEKIVIQVLGVDRSYIGGLAVGVTACSPSKVQIEELPDDSDLLLDRLEYWVVNKDVCRSPEIGDELCFHLTNEGELRYSRNNQRLSTLLYVDRTLPLWVFFDIYGNVQKIRALGTAMHQPPVPPRPRSTSYISGGQQGSLTVMLPPRDNQPQSQNLANMSYSNVNMSPPANQQHHMMRSYSVPSQSLPPPISPSHHNTGSKQPVSLPANPQTNVDNTDADNRDECTVCYERQVNAAIYTCGHLCMCFECAVQVKQRKGLCPICRQEIKDVIKIFKT